MTGYDIIGDIHGHADRLEVLLKALGYEHRNGAWRNPDRQAVFVGDLIDRAADQQAATVRIVRSMIDAGSARIVLGNHEFNAVAFATADASGHGYCRPHSDKNRLQHAAFIDELGFGTTLHRSIIGWFRSIPLWLDLGGVRVVHACWSPRHIDHLRGVLTREHTLTDRVVVDGTTKGNATHDAMETILKGPEVHLDGAYYFDKDGYRRHAARVQWWHPGADSLRTAALIDDGTTLLTADDSTLVELPDRALHDDEVQTYTDPVPVVFGHYWQTGAPRVLSPLAACVDYGAGKGGPLVAYRWSGETKLRNANLTSV